MSNENIKRFVDTFPFSFVDDAEFESKHKRDKEGKFAKTAESGESEEKATNKEESAEKKEETVEKEEKPKFDHEKFKELCGEEFKGVYRQSAVNKLIDEKRGHVKNAFYRKEIGHIDLIWGDERIGMCHIIARRKEQDVDPKRVFQNMADVIQYGISHYNEKKDNFEIWSPGYLFVVSKTFFGEDIKLVVTGFNKDKKPKWLKEKS